MTDQDRGAYTPPTDAPLSFDARQPVRGSRPVPLTLIASGFVLILLVAAIVLFYRSGVRQAGQAPATVGAPVGPLKAEAPPEAQPADPAAGLQIYKSEDGAAAHAAPTFTSPPEQPGPRPAPTAPVQTAQLPPTAPAAPSVLKPAQPLETAPKAVTPPAPKAAPAAAAPPGVAASVQIGAFSSQALADRGFSDAGRIAGVDIAGKTKRVEPIERNGATLYRTSVMGFASRTQAEAFCAQLKAAGKSCFVK
jgi:cytoskeletal protein RodZ